MTRRSQGASLTGAPSPATGADPAALPDRRIGGVLLLAAGSAIPDAVAFVLLAAAGLRLESAQAAAFVVALAGVALLVRHLRGTSAPCVIRAGRSTVIVLLAYALRAGVLSLAVDAWQWPVALAIVPAALAGALALALGFVHVALVPRGSDATHAWKAATVLAIAYLLALRIVYLGQLELIPQEAYYWNYAQHLDIGYLDHPPLTAWLIAFATSARDSEFFVRLPAVASWCVTAAFVALYARDAGGPAVALKSVLLVSTLWFFFLTGWFMVPDAPLTAAWAASLYYLQRAFVDAVPRAWIGAGIAIGIGMLSKYSMVLVPAAAFAYMLVDSRSRRSLATPAPWTGALIALALFSPVIAWNLQNDWASFTFQGRRRLEGNAAVFDFHWFVLFAVALVTPWAVAGCALSLARMRRAWRDPARTTAPPAAADGSERARRRWKFVVVFTVVPLAAFAVPSLWSETKLHWTGPIWLAALPAIAASVPPVAEATGGILGRILGRTWIPLLHALMLGYALVLFYYPVWGLAGLRALPSFVQTPWRSLRAEIQSIEDEVLRETGRRPAVVGLDKHNTADQMTYYDPRGDGALDTASRHLFYDEDALMYERWFPPQDFVGRDLIVVARSRDSIDDPRLGVHATRLGPVRTLALERHGVAAGRFYARVVYGYRAAERPAATHPPAATGAGK
jgi:dolichol-phosphate mannosyltransferase